MGPRPPYLNALVMQRLPIVIFFFFLSISHSAIAQTKHVILISIDGFRPVMYEDSTWPTPNLRYLMKNGVYADHMKSVFPAYTYPSHTAMVTGALPARSKVCFNQPAGSHGEWNWFARYIQVPTLWQVLHAAGLKTAAVMWPASVGAEIDYNMSEIWAVEHPDDRISETRKYATPGLVEAIERDATGKLDSTNMADGWFSLDENAGRAAAYIFKRYKPAFLALHFAEVDGEEHDQGIYGDSVRLAVACNDRAIGDVLEAVAQSGLKDSTAVIIVGDHGFTNFHEVFRPNRLIADLPARFIAAGGSAFLYLSSGADKGQTAAIVQSVKDRLNTLPADKRAEFRFVDRAELDRMGADSSAIMALAALPGLVFSGSMGPGTPVNAGPGTKIQQVLQEGLFITAFGGHHGYDPNIPEMYTGFIAAGAGIVKGGRIEELCVTDIAPLVAALLGIRFTGPDGKLVKGIMERP
jgi:predicted AlkP superfamily pyrophosphatase or phosphodiesterase